MDGAPLAIAPYTGDDALREEARRWAAARIRVYRPAGPAVVLGAGSRPEVELDLDACRDARIALLRRRGGGCAVVIDPGDVIVSVVRPAPGFTGNRAHFETLSRWLIDGLDALGIASVSVEGGSDLVLDNRKFAGACIHRGGGLLHYSCCILVEPDLRLLARCLRHPPREPAYRRGRGHLDFLRPLSAAPGGWTALGLETALRRVLSPADL